MMLQINLLPGSKKATRGIGTLAGSLGSIGASVRDPWLVGAAGAVVVAFAAVGLLFNAQNARAGAVTEKLDRAVSDSTRYARVLDARRKLTAERDSLDRKSVV